MKGPLKKMVDLKIETVFFSGEEMWEKV